jgi:GH43 family beta-xylosidase
MAAAPKFMVDIPDPHDLTGEWVEVGVFDTREEAVAWARETFAADEKGRIYLVSTVAGEEGDE